MRIFLLTALMLCFACSPTRFLLDKGADTSQIGIYLEFDGEVSDENQLAIENCVNEFIDEYNADHNKIKVERSYNSQSLSTLTVRVHKIELVSDGQQTAGVAISLIGLSLPFIMVGAGAEFAIFFFYFPRVHSYSTFYLTDDLTLKDNSRIFYPISSPGFLRSESHQIEKHSKLFKKKLTQVFDLMEKSLK